MEAVWGESENLPKTIIVGVVDASAGGKALPQDQVTGLRSGDTKLARLEGETLAELDVRAEAVPPMYPGCVRVWFREYEGESCN